MSDSLHFKTYGLIERAVEDGLLRGIHRLFKHSSNPIAECELERRSYELVNMVMLELTAIIEFDCQCEICREARD